MSQQTPKLIERAPGRCVSFLLGAQIAVFFLFIASTIALVVRVFCS